MTEPNPDHTDSKGRTPATRVMAVQRVTPAIAEELWQATRLLTALLDAAAEHGVTIDDFDWTVDLPGACLDVIRAKARKEDDPPAGHRVHLADRKRPGEVDAPPPGF